MIDLQKESTLNNFIHTPVGVDWRKNASKITSHEGKYGEVCQYIREMDNSENVDGSKSAKEFWTTSQISLLTDFIVFYVQNNASAVISQFPISI